ncbi:MAG: hypothetical protein LBR76_07655 [Oscillospiraceae bacterium]|jgi:hypothetical protein|nr:hypothetical protein [Oscillospiraceae bacterium]
MLKKFRYWFVNIYWYHYRLHTAAVLFAGLLIAFCVYSMVTRVTPDVFLTLASDKPVGYSQSDMLNEYVNEKAGGGLTMAGSALYLSESDTMNWELLHVSFIDNERYLFIIGEGLRSFFAEQADLFTPAADMGLPADPEIPCLVPLTGAPYLAEAGLDGEPMFGLVKRPAVQKDGLPAPEEKTRQELAAQYLRFLLEGT